MLLLERLGLRLTACCVFSVCVTCFIVLLYLSILFYYNLGNFLSRWSGVTVCISPYHSLLQMKANLIPVKYWPFAPMWLHSFPFLWAAIATSITSIFVTWDGNDNPLQYSCLENPMDRQAWRATVHGAAKCQTGLNNFNWMHASFIFAFLTPRWL